MDSRDKAIEAAAKAAWLVAQQTSRDVVPWEEVQPKAKQARLDLYRAAIDAYEAELARNCDKDRLTAAAPEMLRVLQGIQGNAVITLADIDATITKATGESA